MEFVDLFRDSEVFTPFLILLPTYVDVTVHMQVQGSNTLNACVGKRFV